MLARGTDTRGPVLASKESIAPTAATEERPFRYQAQPCSRRERRSHRQRRRKPTDPSVRKFRRGRTLQQSADKTIKWACCLIDICLAINLLLLCLSAAFSCNIMGDGHGTSPLPPSSPTVEETVNSWLMEMSPPDPNLSPVFPFLDELPRNPVSHDETEPTAVTAQTVPNEAHAMAPIGRWLWAEPARFPPRHTNTSDLSWDTAPDIADIDEDD